MLSAGIQYYTDEYIVNTFARYSNSASGEGTLDALVQRRLESPHLPLRRLRVRRHPLSMSTVQGCRRRLRALPPRLGRVLPAKFSDVPYTQWYYEYVSPSPTPA